MNSSDRVILIIEDDFLIREVITTILECEDFQVIEADEGTRGIELAEQLLPDLILCDIMMPKLSGFNVLKQLNKKEKTARIPFIFISAKAKKTDVRFGLKLGADGYICKPFTRDDLMSAVKKALEQKISQKYASEPKLNRVGKKLKQLNKKIKQLRQTNSDQFFTPTNGWQGRFEPVVMTAEQIITMTEDMHHALEREEFELYYQPQVNITTGKIVGAEALLRWQHPERGLMLPAEFMPVAEKKDSIVPIGDWVLTTACQQAKKWQDMGLSLRRVAANISASQLKLSNLSSRLFEILVETGVKPEYLGLELTESHAIENLTQIQHISKKLKPVGIQIALDDLGTGDSYVSYLTSLELDMLKISNLFVENIDRSPKKQAVVQLIIELGHTLNLQVLAEGVETEAELAVLKQQHCDEFQGYLFSRPLPVQDFEALLRSDRND